MYVQVTGGEGGWGGRVSGEVGGRGVGRGVCLGTVGMGEECQKAKEDGGKNERKGGEKKQKK